MEYEPFNVVVIKKTDKAAFLAFLDFDEERIWVPFSQINQNDEYLKPSENEIVLYISEWWAKR